MTALTVSFIDDENFAFEDLVDLARGNFAYAGLVAVEFFDFFELEDAGDERLAGSHDGAAIFSHFIIFVYGLGFGNGDLCAVIHDLAIGYNFAYAPQLQVAIGVYNDVEVFICTVLFSDQCTENIFQNPHHEVSARFILLSFCLFSL